MTIRTFIADVGNTRIKCARCTDVGIAEMATWYHDDRAGPDRIRDLWRLVAGDSWTLAGSSPTHIDAFRRWLEDGGQTVEALASAADLPVRVAVRHPETVGIDRLLNAVAVAGYLTDGEDAIVVDAGTAVTVDLVGAERGRASFLGGVIMPGPRLMGRALHDYTAKLPRIETFPDDFMPELPGLDTESAIRSGILCAVAGGIERAVAEYRRGNADRVRRVWLAGGYAPLLGKIVTISLQEDSGNLTLEGIFRSRRTAGGANIGTFGSKGRVIPMAST